MKITFRYIFQFSCMLVCMTAATNMHAQSSAFFNYQALIIDADGNPYEGTVGIKISILQPSESGDVVYSERHTKESDKKGLVSFRVGEGAQVYSGEFDTINWSRGPSFIRTEIAPGGGYTYTITSTRELASVPLALYARTADSVASSFQEQDPLFQSSAARLITPEDTVRWNAQSKRMQYQIGDFLEGGIVFYLEPDGEHGLIASEKDIAESVVWGEVDLVIGAGSNYNGQGNTELIVNANGNGNYAAYYCDSLTINGYDDWYLPSADEMFLLFRSRYQVNKVLEGDDNENSTVLKTEAYWTSTEQETSSAFVFINGNLTYNSKDQPGLVRAIRTF